LHGRIVAGDAREIDNQVVRACVRNRLNALGYFSSGANRRLFFQFLSWISAGFAVQLGRFRRVRAIFQQHDVHAGALDTIVVIAIRSTSSG
jgi:hypothetical protein